MTAETNVWGWWDGRRLSQQYPRRVNLHVLWYLCFYKAIKSKYKMDWVKETAFEKQQLRESSCCWSQQGPLSCCFLEELLEHWREMFSGFHDLSTTFRGERETSRQQHPIVTHWLLQVTIWGTGVDIIHRSSWIQCPYHTGKLRLVGHGLITHVKMKCSHV